MLGVGQGWSYRCLTFSPVRDFQAVWSRSYAFAADMPYLAWAQARSWAFGISGLALAWATTSWTRARFWALVVLVLRNWSALGSWSLVSLGLDSLAALVVVSGMGTPSV